MKTAILLLFFLYNVSVLGNTPWKLKLTHPKEKIDLVIDLHEESIEVPTLEMFGPMNGYLGGNIFGVWYVTSFQIKDKLAEIKVANDLGSENQKIELKQLTDSTWSMKFVGPNVVRRVSGKKLVKVPSDYIMISKN